MPRSRVLNLLLPQAGYIASMNTTSAQIANPRQVERLIQGHSTSDGAGVKLVRLLTQDLQRRLDPFLMLDAFGTDTPGDYIGGFPSHPHRGFETVTYIMDGAFQHQDSHGGGGFIKDGATQWMTAGGGILHIETPPVELVRSGGTFHGVQLWVNLPGHQKMTDPAYQNLEGGDVTLLSSDDGGALLRVIASLGVGDSMLLIDLSGALWIGTLILFLIAYGPMLWAPRSGVAAEPA